MIDLYCEPLAGFNVTFVGSSGTAIPISTNGTNYEWNISPPTMIVNNSTNTPFNFTLTGNGPWLITLSITIDGEKFRCTKYFNLVPPPPSLCDFTAQPRIGCSEFFFDLDIDQTAFPTGTIHGFTFVGAHDDNGAALTLNSLQNANFPWEQRIQNIRTFDAFVTITHDWLLPNGTTGQCSLDFDFANDASLAPFHGIFIGGHCTNHDIDFFTTPKAAGTYSDMFPLLPPTELTNTSFPTNIPLYSLGNLIVNRDYRFSGINVYPGPNAVISIDPTGNTSGHLRLENGTIIEPTEVDNCPCKWKGIEVHRGGRLLSNGTATNRNEISDAFYAVAPINGPVTGANVPLVNLSNTNFLGNFIGIQATEGTYSLQRFDNTYFNGLDFDNPTIPNPAGLGNVPLGTCNFGCPFVPNLGPEYPYLDYTPGYAGILQNVQMIVPNFVGTTNINIFQNIAAGILIDDANAFIGRCRFEDIERGRYQNLSCSWLNSGFGIRFLDGEGNHRLIQRGLDGFIPGFTFQNVEHGIYVGSGSFGTQGDIQRNSMDAVQKGISFVGSNELDPSIPSGNITVGTAIHNTINANKDFGYCVDAYGIGGFDSFNDFTIFNFNNNTVKVDIKSIPSGVGIWANGSIVFNPLLPAFVNPSTSTNFNNNTVEIANGLDGIRIDHVNGSFARENSILLNEQGLQITPFTESTGIRVSSGEGHQILCNDITDNGSPVRRATGLSLESAIESRTEGNKILYTDYGAAILGLSTSEDNFNVNTFTGPMRLGMFVSQTGELGQQIHRGNAWHGSFNNNGNSMENYHGNPSTSLFRVNSSGTGLMPPPVIQTPFAQALTPWFEDDIFGQIDFEVNCDRLEQKQRISNKADEAFLAGTMNDMPAGALYERSYRLYEKLSQNPSLAMGVFADFKAAQDNDFIGHIFAIQRDYSASFEMDALIHADILTKQSLIDQLELELSSLYETLYDGGNILSIQSDIESKQTEQEQLEASIRTHYVQQAAERKNVAEGLMQQLSNLNAASVPEQNELTYWQFYISTVGSGLLPMEDVDVEQIEAIAYQCPDEGGLAVFKARSLYQSISGHLVDVAENCATALERSEPNITLASPADVWVYPNPSSDYIQIDWNTTQVPAEWTIRFYDATGKMILTKAFGDADQITKIDLHTLPKGNYFYSIIGASEIIKSDVLTILK